jgi:hypothetical protein
MDVQDNKITGTPTLTNITDDPPPAYSQHSNTGKDAVMHKDALSIPSNPSQGMFDNPSWGSGDERMKRAAKLFYNRHTDRTATGREMNWKEATSHLQKLHIENL